MRIYILAAIVLGISKLFADSSYTIDLSNDFEMKNLNSSGVELRKLGKYSDTQNLPNDSHYLIKLPGDVEIVFSSHLAEASPNHKNPDSLARLVFSGSDPQYHLTINEALEVLEQFHDVFDIPKESLYKWFEPLQNNEMAASFYQAAGARLHYPRISLEAANSYFGEKPVFLILKLSFDEQSFRRLGVSAETNKVTNLTFDVPAIIESVRAQNTKEEAAQVVEEGPVVITEIDIDEQTVEVEIEEPSESAPVEVAEESVDQSSRWWLWLIGALVVAVGLGLAVRRKS